MRSPSPTSYLKRLAYEPPFRLLVKKIFAMLPCSIERRATWDLSERPHYLLGLLFAARQAKRQQMQEFSAIEFGVAGGKGLIALQKEAEAVEHATGVSIRVFGFDAGPSGMPSNSGDYRDFPDIFIPGDFPMDVTKLREKLTPRTTLILGDIRQTIETFQRNHHPSPIRLTAISIHRRLQLSGYLIFARYLCTWRCTLMMSICYSAIGGPANYWRFPNSMRNTPSSKSIDGADSKSVGPSPRDGN